MPLCKVKAKVDHLTVMDRTLMKGETGDCQVDRAKYLVKAGLVEVIDGDEPTKPTKPTTAATKGDVSERATAPAAAVAERQVKKG